MARRQSTQRVREELGALQHRVCKGKLKAPEKSARRTAPAVGNAGERSGSYDSENPRHQGAESGPREVEHGRIVTHPETRLFVFSSLPPYSANIVWRDPAGRCLKQSKLFAA